MRYAFDAETTGSRRLGAAALDNGDPLSGYPERPPRDVKKLFLVAGLGILSWVATYVGMLELIQANMGDLPITHKAIIGFSVAMLMVMIIWLLDQMFAPIGALTRLAYIAGYVFLTLISVGFGFGFYWKVLESRAESSRSAESAVSQVKTSLHAAATRLEQLDATLVQLAQLSTGKAELERTTGGSCPNSKPGDGPRRRMRDEDAARFSFASEFVKGRVGAVRTDMGALDADLARISSNDASMIDAATGTRNEFMKSLGRKLDMTVTGFNAFRTDPQLRQLRTDLAERAEKSTFGDPKAGGFVCPDPQLQQALHGAVRAIDQLPELTKPEIAAVEGSEATIEAFRRLTATFYGLLSFKLPPSADELRELQQKAVQSVESGAQARLADPETAGLSKRDYVPLAIAVFVDLCLLLVSLGRPLNRLNSLVPKMREAERGPVIEILSRFNDIHKDREIRESFELFRHVVFDMNGDYYVAVPLDAPLRMNPHQREELRIEAQLLSNLFASFEKERIFTRTWVPFTRQIQRKLARQGSKFAEAEAFRVYRFRKGAWSEIILGAVMGAARRAETEKKERRAMGIEEPTLPGFGSSASRGRSAPRDDEHELRPPFAPRQPGPTRGSGPSVHALRSSTSGLASATRPAESGTPPAEVSAAYGRYAHFNPPHPRGTESGAPRERSGTFRAANGNTAPGPRREAATAAIEEKEAAVREALVAFGATDLRGSSPSPAVESFDRLTPGEATMVSGSAGSPRSDDTIVVLRRETATVAIPAGDQSPAGEIISRLGQAIARSGEEAAAIVAAGSGDDHSAATAPSEVVLELPSPEADLSQTAVQPEAGSDILEDPDGTDAVAIASRLRPVVAGE